MKIKQYFLYNKNYILIFFLLLYFPVFFKFTNSLTFYIYIFDCQLLNCSLSVVTNVLYDLAYDKVILIHILNIFITGFLSLIATRVWIMYFKGNVKRKRILKGIISTLCILFIINVAGLVFGFHVSIPPSPCDLEYGYVENKSDLLTTKRDACLYRLEEIRNNSPKKQSLFQCLLIEKNYSYGRADLDKWDCVSRIYVHNNDYNKCKSLNFNDSKAGCIVELAKKEMLSTNYEAEAMEFAKINISTAIQSCNKFTINRNQVECYKKVSNYYSGITQKNLFNPESKSNKLINICLNNPDEYEWLACLWGNSFDTMTGTDILFPRFKNVVISNSFRRNTFCNLFNPDIGIKGIGGYYSSVRDIFTNACPGKTL